MTLSYDAGTFTLETREGTFEFVGRDIVSIEGRAKKTIGKFTAVIHNNVGGSAQKVKICRVF